jgi:hypothetical protein
LAAFVLAAPAGAQQIVIDTFAADQSLFLVSPGTVSGEVDDAASILQTERNLRLSASAVGPGGEVSETVSGGTASFTRTNNATGTMEMWWDGDNGGTFNPTGLGGVNLTANGQDRFRVTVSATNSTSLNLRLQVWTDGSNNSVRNFTLPSGGGVVELLYSSFTPNAGSGASFNNVGAIFLSTFESGGLFTHTLDEIRTTPVELQSFEVQ